MEVRLGTPWNAGTQVLYESGGVCGIVAELPGMAAVGMPIRTRTAAIWVLLFSAAYPLAESLSAARDAVEAYRDAIAVAESGSAPRGIESALEVVDELREVLQADVPDGTRSVLESLPEHDFAQLEELPGVFVQRIEVLVVNPEPGFFLELSARVGDEADRRFASALAAAYRNAKWHVYVQPQTDYSGCTVFGEGRLLETYLAWSAMERDFPDRYVSAVAKQRDRVEDRITRSTCACGDRASVVEGLERIAAALTPADPILAAVDARLAALYEGRSNMRFGCIAR